MDATQAVDWGVEDEATDDQAHPVEVGSLSVSHPDGTAELHRLCTGQNIVARRGSQQQKDDEHLERWRVQYNGRDKTNGVFLESSSISSPHAIIFLEKGGELCFVKDLGSKNRTMLEIPGKRRQVLERGDRWSVSSGDTLIFGNARCLVDIDPAAARADQGPSTGTQAEGQRTDTLNQADTQAYMSFGEAMEEGGCLEGAEGATAAAAAADANIAAAAAAAAAGQEAVGRSRAVAEQATLVEPTQVEMQQATQLQTSLHPAPAIAAPDVAAAGGPSSQSPTRAMGRFDVAAAGNPSSQSPTRAMGGPDVAAAGGPSSRSPTQAMSGPDVAAAGGPSSRSPTQSRTTRSNLGDDYDEGDSIWLPPLTGAVASQQEVMSPPKEDALPARLAPAAAAAGPAAAAAAGPTQLLMEPFHPMPRPELEAETQLAEPSLGQEYPTQNIEAPIPAAGAAGGGTPAPGGATQAGPSGSGGSGGLSLRPILPGSADPGTPRIGARHQEESLGGVELDSEEGTLQIAPSRRPRRKTRVLADTQDTLGLPPQEESGEQEARPQPAEPEASAVAPPEEETQIPQDLGHTPDQATLAVPGQAHQQVQQPNQASEPVAAPEQATEATAPEEATKAAAPEQATEAAAPEQANAAAAPEQLAKAAAPEDAMAAAAPRQATEAPAAAEIGPGGWRIKKKHNAPADAPSPPARHGPKPSARPDEGTGADVDFKAHVEKKTILSPRQEYIPPMQQAQLQASSSGWKRKGIGSSLNPSQSSEPVPVLLPASPPAVAATVATAAPPGVEGGPSPARDTSQPQQAAVEEGAPARPLWQDLLSDILPGENTEAAEIDARVAPEASGAAGQHVPGPESHMPNTQDVSAAITNVGDLAACFADSQAPAVPAPILAAGTPGTARRGARRLPASVRAAGQATIPEKPGPDAAARTTTTPGAEATGVEDAEQTEAPADQAQAAAAEEAAARPRSARIRAPSARGRGRGRRSAAAAADEAAPDQALAAAEAAPDQAPAAAEAAPNQAPMAAEGMPNEAAATVEAAPDLAPAAAVTPDQAAAAAEAVPKQAVAAAQAAPDQATAGEEGVPDQAAAKAAPPSQTSPAEAAPKEGAVSASNAASEEAAARKALPKRGRGKAGKFSAAAASQPDTGDAARALAPDSEAAVFADEPDEPAKEARPSSSVQKVFSRSGRRSSAAAAAEEAAPGAGEATPEPDLMLAPEKKQARPAPRGRGKKAETAAEQGNVGQAAVADTKKAVNGRNAVSLQGATGGLTESQTAAHTLAQVRAAQGQAPRVLPVPEDAAPASAGKTRGGGKTAGPRAAKRGRASKDQPAAVAGEEPEDAAGDEGPAEPRGKKRGRGQREGADDLAAEVANDPAAEAAEAAPPAKRGRTSAAAAAKHSDSNELRKAASAGGDKKDSAVGGKGRALAKKQVAQEAVAALPPASKRRRQNTAPSETEAGIHEGNVPASAVEGPDAAQTSALPNSKKQSASDAAVSVAVAPPAPATRRGRVPAAAAAAAESPPAKEAAAQPPASKKRAGKQRPPSEAAATAEAAASGEHTEEVEADAQMAEAPSRNRGRQAQAPSEAAAKATGAIELPKGKGRAARPGPTGTSTAAPEAETAQKIAPAPKRGRKSAAAAAPKGSQAEEAVTAQGSQPAKRSQEISATAKEANAAQEEAAPAVKRRRKSIAAKESQAAEAIASQPEGTAAAGGASGPAPKRGSRKSQAAAAIGAASKAAEAGLFMQLRGTDAKPPRVLISTCVDAKLRQSITKTVERLGGTITASAQDFTVFVTLDASGGDKDRGFTKSLNALSALASGSPIVSEKWVDACARSDAFVSAKEFLLKDPAAENKFGFSLAAAYEAAQQSLLLDGIHVFLTPGLTAAEADKGQGLRMLVQRAGGNVAETVPKKLPASGAQCLLLGDEKNKAKEAAWAKKALHTKGVKLHGRSALINGLMTQRLDRDADVLLET